MQSHKSGRGGCVLLCADKTVQPLRLLPIPTSPSAIHRLRDPTSRPYFPWGGPCSFCFFALSPLQVHALSSIRSMGPACPSR